MWQDARSPAASESQCSPSRQVTARGAHPGRAWQLAVTGTLAFKNGTGVWVTALGHGAQLSVAQCKASRKRRADRPFRNDRRRRNEAWWMHHWGAESECPSIGDIIR